MQRGIKIRLLPTKEQEILFWKSAGTARWAYNYFLSENERIYKEYLANGKTGKRGADEKEVRRHINNVLKKTTHKWLGEVGSNVMKQGVKDADLAIKRFLKGISGKPHFKSKRKSKISFYVNYESLKRTQNGFHGEKLGVVKTAMPLPKIKKGAKYVNPHISFDGKHWCLSVAIDITPPKVELTEESLGIDLGVKDLAIVANRDASQTMVYKNINKTVRIKKLEKRLRREQRKLSRRIEGNIKGYPHLTARTGGKKRKPIWKQPLRECQNINRQNQKIRLIHKKIADIRLNYLHQTTAAIVKTKPSRIVMETLNVQGMMKNRHLSKAIAAQGFYEFKRQIMYKAEFYGIEFVEADKFYASSKTCSKCKAKKTDLKLSDRIYKCEICGAVIDRDLNAAINLANYRPRDIEGVA